MEVSLTDENLSNSKGETKNSFKNMSGFRDNNLHVLFAFSELVNHTGNVQFLSFLVGAS